MADFDTVVADFPKPLTAFQRHDLKTQSSHLHQAEGKLKRAAYAAQKSVEDTEKRIENAKREIGIIKGDIKVEPVQIRAAGTIAKGAKQQTGEKRKRDDVDDGKEAREEEDGEKKQKDETATAAAPEATSSGEADEKPQAEGAEETKTDDEKKTDETEKKPEAPVPVAAPAPPAPRQRPVLGKGSKMFASLTGFLKGAQKSNDKLNEASKTRQEIAQKSKIDEQERIIATHNETKEKQVASKVEIDEKVEAIVSRKGQYNDVLKRIDCAEQQYSKAFSLEAKGPLYSVYFRPAEHNEKTLAALNEQLTEASKKYLDFRSEVDPLLQEVENRRIEIEAKKKAAAAAANNASGAGAEAALVEDASGFVEDKDEVVIEEGAKVAEDAGLFF